MCSKKCDLMPNRFLRSWIPVSEIKLEIRYICLFLDRNRIDSTWLHHQGKRHFPRHDSVDLCQRVNIACQIAPLCIHDDDSKNADKKFKSLCSALTFAHHSKSEKPTTTINFHTRKRQKQNFFHSSDVCLMSAQNKVNHRRPMNCWCIANGK